MTKALVIIVICTVIFAGCCADVVLTPTSNSTAITPTKTQPPSPALTPTGYPTPFVIPVASALPSTPSYTPTSSPTAELHEATPVFVSTPFPGVTEPIQASNLQRLTYAAQWGKGSILGTAFTPDGSAFVVGSAFGIATYDLRDLNSPPSWTPFDPPYAYNSLFFSSDGNYLRLESNTANQVRSYTDGQIVRGLSGTVWLRTTKLMGSRDAFAFSPDGKRKLKSYVNYESVREFECVREVWNADTEELLYRLSDETIAVQYDDYHKPEGCDLKSFSYCGNVYDPSVATPYRVAFSSSGASLAILYRASNLWNSNRFSTLRVYRGEDGALLHTIGSFKQPVETFAYSPGGNLLLVGYVDGSIQLWDIARGIVTFSAWHFSAPIIALKYSSDGDFLILQRPDWLEVRRTSDGALRSRYQATAFAVSPTENLIAIGTKDGSILVQNIDNGQGVYHIQAHNDEVYALAFSPDGQRLTSSGQDCTVSSWDAHTGRFLNYFEENITDAYQGTNTASRIFIYHMQYISGTNQLIGYGSWARVVSWDANSGTTQYLIEPEPLEYYQGMVTLNPHFPEFFGIDLDNQRFYVDNIGYDLDTGEKVGEYRPPVGLPEGCAPTGPISRDGELLFTRGYDSREGQICILDAKDLHLVQTIEIVPRDARAYVTVDWIYLSPDGKQLIINTLNGSIYVYGIAP